MPAKTIKPSPKSGLDLFLNAQSEKKSKAKSSAPEVAIRGIENLAALKWLADQIEALSKTECASVNEAAKRDYFYPETEKLGKRPDNCRGVEGEGNASVELRKRSSTSQLTPAEIKLLSKFEVPFGVQRCFKINPEYAENVELLTKVGEALSKVKDLPGDFIVKDEKVVVTDESLDKAFTLKGNALRVVLPIVTTPAVKPKWEGDELTAMQKVLSFFGLKVEAGKK